VTANSRRRNFPSSLRLGCQQAERGDPLDRLGTRPAVELGERAADVHLDGARADEQRPADLPAREAVPDVPDDLELPPPDGLRGVPAREWIEAALRG
jgi:hypothetical protein